MAKLEHKFTEQYLEWLSENRPPDRPIIYDTGCDGLAVRVGSKSIVFLVIKKIKNAGSQSPRVKIGDYKRGNKIEGMTLGAARARAREFVSEMRSGIDPRQEIRKRGAATLAAVASSKRTFEVVWSEWAAVADVTASARYVKYRAGVKKWLMASPLFKTPMADISVNTIDQTYRPIFNAVRGQRVDINGQLIARQPIPSWLPIKSLGPDTALTLFGNAHTAWKFAATLAEFKERDPFDAWRVANKSVFPKPVKRKRSLRLDKEEEGPVFVREIERLRHDETNQTLACTADYVMLVLLLGTRRMETMRLRWSDVDMAQGEIRFRPEHVKNASLHVLPLEPWAREILAARKVKNAERRLATGPEDWVFPSRRISSAQAAEIKLAKAENREPPEWAVAGVTHISSTIEILDLLGAHINIKIALHDLRRTVAGALTLAKAALAETSKSLNHSPAGNYAQSKDYVQEHDFLHLLRPLFAKHEGNMRRFAGLDVVLQLTAPLPTSAQKLTDKQRTTLEIIQMMMKQAGLDSVPPVALDQQ